MLILSNSCQQTRLKRLWVFNFHYNDNHYDRDQLSNRSVDLKTSFSLVLQSVISICLMSMCRVVALSLQFIPSRLCSCGNSKSWEEEAPISRRSQPESIDVHDRHVPAEVQTTVHGNCRVVTIYDVRSKPYRTRNCH